MDLHPGPEKRRFAGGGLGELEPIQRALRENQDWYQVIVEHSQDLLCVHDLEGRLLSVNPAPARVLGYSVEELLQIPMREMMAPEHRSQFDAYLSQIVSAGEARGLLVVVTRSGERRIWEYHNTLRTEGVPSPIVRGTAHDVTERKRVETLLRETSENLLSKVRENENTIRELKLFRTLVDHCTDAIQVVDPETLRFLDANEKACSDLGYSREELLSLGVFDIDPAVTQSSVVKIREALRETGVMVIESLHRRKDGSTFPVEVSMRWVHVGADYVISIARDLTAQKRAEKLQHDAREELLSEVGEHQRTIRELRLFRTLVDQGNDAVRVVDPETRRFVDVNERACSELGYSREEMLALGVFDIDPMVNDAFIAKAREELRRSGSLVIESLHRRKDGSTFPVEVSMKRVRLEQDYVLAISRDITERKRAEEKLAASESRYRAVHERSPVGICWVDSGSGHFLRVNRKYCEITGRTEEDLLSRDFQSITHPDDLAENCRTLQQLSRGEVQHYEIEKRYLRPDGSVRWVDAEIVAMGAEGQSPLWHMAMIQDITDRKRSEERLREYARVVEGLEEMIVVVDRDYRYVIANRAFLNYRALEKAEVIGHRVDEVVNQEAFEAVVKQKMDECFEGRIVQYEIRYNYPHQGERDLFISYFPIEGTSGVDRIAGVLRDVTERKRAEEALRQNVVQLQEVTEELRVAREKLAEEKLYLEQAIDTELGFGEIIGRSGALKDVMEKVAKVAPSDATVLLLGETGTGKELVARALHRLSRRQGNSFIKLNCAAIPSGLLESELFGHEKGAFTGAVAKKIGRLELADQGTLFLDEIGEIPLDLQPKLLRVLQDQEFERLGGTQTLKVNFRLLAASNRDLLQSVKHREFRSDLYYRLNVFPIRLPPLRERREDIRLLAEHFVRKYALRMNKSITSIPAKTMEALVRWEWPGNIRELENLVERSVILTPGSLLQAPLSELHRAGEEIHGVTLRDKERERILRALRECRGQVGGPNGAAARLGMKRTTLQSKITQLGINYPE